MENILVAILDTPNKTRGVIFLKDDTLLLTKSVYREENQLVIKSQTDAGCRVLLNRRDLLAIQDLEVCIYESALRPSDLKTVLPYYEQCFYGQIQCRASKQLIRRWIQLLNIANNSCTVPITNSIPARRKLDFDS